MTYQIPDDAPQDAYTFINARLRTIDSAAKNAITALNGATIPANQLLNLEDSFRVNLAAVEGKKNTPGLVAHAKLGNDDPNYDVAVQYAAVKILIETVITTIVTLFPKSTAIASVGPLVWAEINTGGAPVQALKDEIQAVDDAIEIVLPS